MENNIIIDNLHKPEVILFDWQNTLASTIDALYNAMNSTLLRLKPVVGLRDNELAKYVLKNHKLPDYIKEEKKLSRTDLFHTIFADEIARENTHNIFNECYHEHFKDVHALGDEIEPMLKKLKESGIKIGIVTNRAREFIDHELDAMGWSNIFNVVVAVGDGYDKKPSPEPLLGALDKINQPSGKHIWFIGDSKSDIQCGVRSGSTAIFYNFASWKPYEISTIFENSKESPDVIINNYKKLTSIVDNFL